MPSDVVALVSSDDVIAAVRVHADRVHDLLLRNGQTSRSAVAVATRSAQDLIVEIVEHPETVVDLAGWWFGRCLSTMTGEPFLTVDPVGSGDDGRSMLAGTELEFEVRSQVARLQRNERIAIMLRDAYDLPVQAVAVTLGRAPASTAELIANARLHLAAAYDGQPTPELGRHVGRASINLAGLAALADGSADAATTLTLRRHLEACEVCATVFDAQSKARRLLLGLPVIAMPDSARDQLLYVVTAGAESELSSHDEVLVAAAAESARRGLPLILVTAALLVAAVVGGGIGVLSRRAQQADSSVDVGPLVPQPTVATFTPASIPPTNLTSSPSTPVTARTLPTVIISTSRPAPVIKTSAPPTTASTQTTTSSAPAVAPTFGIAPSSGPAGAVITASGTDFLDDATITITFNDAETVTTTSDDFGDFTTTITADGTLPASYEIDATDGITTLSAEFQQTT